MTARIISVLVVTVALSTAAGFVLYRAGPVEIPFTDEVRISQGRTLYGAHCAACHGQDLGGQPEWQNRDVDGFYPAPPMDADGHAWHHADPLLFNIVKDGPGSVVGNGYKSHMPGFSDALSDAEILAILAYIKSNWPIVIVEAHNWVNGKPSAAPVSLEDLAACGLSLGISEAQAGGG